jgi:hypothetical protein
MDMKSRVRLAVVVLLSVALAGAGSAAPPRPVGRVVKPAATPAVVGPRVTAPPLCADIAVTALTVTLNEGGRVPTAREAGFDRVRVTVLVRNTRAIAPVVRGALRLSVLRDGQAIGQQDFTLDRDPTPVSLDDEFAHGAQPSHVYRAVVSSADNECRADNNEMSKTVTEAGLHPVAVRQAERLPLAPVMVRPNKPDLRVDRMWFAERPDGTGELPVNSLKMFQTQVYLGCAYSNVGTDVTKQFFVGIFDNGPRIHEEIVAGLGGGASGQVVVPFPPHAFGHGTAWCIVDWQLDVEEANEGNNRMDRSYQPAHGTPDLKADRAYLDGPTEVTKGDAVRLVCEFSNAGGMLVGGMYGWFYVDGKGVQSFNRPDLPPGQHDSQVLTITALDFTHGPHSLYCWVLPYYDDWNTEPQIPNNKSPEVSFTVIDPAIDKPDCRMARIEFRPYNPMNPPVDASAIKAGSGIQILCSFLNDGKDFPGGSGKARLLIDGELVKEETLVAERFHQLSGLSYDEWHFMVGGVGNHTCTCVADPDGVVPELNEGNNSLSVPFTVVP